MHCISAYFYRFRSKIIWLVTIFSVIASDVCFSQISNDVVSTYIASIEMPPEKIANLIEIENKIFNGIKEPLINRFYYRTGLNIKYHASGHKTVGSVAYQMALRSAPNELTDIDFEIVIYINSDSVYSLLGNVAGYQFKEDIKNSIEEAFPGEYDFEYLNPALRLTPVDKNQTYTVDIAVVNRFKDQAQCRPDGYECGEIGWGVLGVWDTWFLQNDGTSLLIPSWAPTEVLAMNNLLNNTFDKNQQMRDEINGAGKLLKMWRRSVYGNRQDDDDAVIPSISLVTMMYDYYRDRDVNQQEPLNIIQDVLRDQLPKKFGDRTCVNYLGMKIDLPVYQFVRDTLAKISYVGKQQLCKDLYQLLSDLEYSNDPGVDELAAINRLQKYFPGLKHVDEPRKARLFPRLRYKFASWRF